MCGAVGPLLFNLFEAAPTVDCPETVVVPGCIGKLGSPGFSHFEDGYKFMHHLESSKKIL